MQKNTIHEYYTQILDNIISDHSTIKVKVTEIICSASATALFVCVDTPFWVIV